VCVCGWTGRFFAHLCSSAHPQAAPSFGRPWLQSTVSAQAILIRSDAQGLLPSDSSGLSAVPLFSLALSPVSQAIFVPSDNAPPLQLLSGITQHTKPRSVPDQVTQRLLCFLCLAERVDAHKAMQTQTYVNMTTCCILICRAQGVDLCVPVGLLHVAAFSLGYFLSKGLGFNEKTARTVSIETGWPPPCT
jgi:hypothetical protein